jgi:hypothetical protein
MKKGGKGGSNTLTGLKFEKRADVLNAFDNLDDYEVKGEELIFKGKVVANVYKQYGFYNIFLKNHKIDWQKYFTKRLIPDQAIFVLKTNKLYIIEMKFQKGAGSVDEKLQTCDFKRKQYQKLILDTGIKVEYYYILSDWFKKPLYKDVLKYIKLAGCDYFFEELPFVVLGLPEPES